MLSMAHQDSSLEEDIILNNGRIDFNENIFNTENHYLICAAIEKFRDWRSRLEKMNYIPTLADIPEVFADLIAVLVHEDGSVEQLATNIDYILSPFDRDIKTMKPFILLLKKIIPLTATQERYGLSDVALLMENAPSKIPESLSIYRWQANDTTKFPQQIMEAADKRRKKRKVLSRVLTDTFLKLPKEERMILLLEKGENRFDVLYDLVRSSNLKNINRTSVIFTPFEASEYVTVAPNLKYPTKKFDTDMINQLTRSDLREVFLDSLASRSKRKRGYVKDEDMCAKELEKAWLQFNRAVGRERDGFYNSSLYKRIKTLKMKLLQFHEDIRPAYYGTWTKRCHIVDGRHPFAKEDNLLNYQHDSEAEWDIDVDINDNISITFSMDDDDPIQLMSSDDEWMLSPTEDEMSLYNGMGDTDSIMSNGHCSEGKRATWLVPNGYLSEGEGIHVKQTPYRRRRRQLSIVSRPASWPISTNKHFPLKPIILGPSFEVADEPVNHPLSDFRLHFINDEICPEGCYPFDEMPYDSSSYKYHLNLESEDPSNIASSKVICYEPSKVKPLMYARESDKILDSIREGVIEFIKGNNTKTMMELMIMIRKSKLVCDYSISQLQAIIHDLAYQTVGEDNKEYVWCIR